MRVDGFLSYKRRITAAGVPQSRVLGLLLISVYIKDVPKQPAVELSVSADHTGA